MAQSFRMTGHFRFPFARLSRSFFILNFVGHIEGGVPVQPEIQLCDALQWQTHRSLVDTWSGNSAAPKLFKGQGCESVLERLTKPPRCFRALPAASRTLP